ncbi:MAG TPA: Fe-S protein assembly co-chaperone HscB [Anaeromyxobacteraceae bacterium]|nr:Fe-S protein assembly co-chaperone HscB [Anaeromyxobacteraceae bacterium]
MACWSCKAEVALGEPLCPSCRKIQPVDPREDFFSLLGLPRVFGLDLADLEVRFRERSRLVHPDRYAKAEPRERRLALERATRLNDAHRVLRDWRQRAAYLLRLASQDAFGDARAAHDAEFLEEQLELREALALAQADGDAGRLRELASGARARLRALEEELGRMFDDERWYSDHALDVARRLARARYYDNLAADAERAAATGRR